MQPRLTVGWRRLRPGGQEGVALVEFALVLPLVLLLLFGIIDVGKAINYWNDETHLANEAARQAIVNKCPSCSSGQAINDWIRGQADSSELRNGSSGSVSPPGLKVCIWFPKNTNPADDPVRDHAIGDPVQVIVHAQYNWLGYLVGQGMRANSDLTGTSTMRLEQTYNANGTVNGDSFYTGPSTAPKWDASGTC